MKLVGLVLCFLELVRCINSAKILFYPFGHCYNSHLLQMEKLMGMISQNGHTAKMLINTKYEKPPFRGTTDLRQVDTIYFPEPKNLTTFCDFNTIEAVTENRMKVIDSFVNMAYANCENILKDKAVMNRLKNEKFSMIMIDALDFCGLVLVNYLNIPYIAFASAGLGSHSDVDAPTPLAYVPSMLGESTHKMGFIERVQNFFFYTFQNLHFYVLIYQYQKLQEKYLNLPRHIYDVYKRPSVRLIPGQFPFDYPKPVMPDMLMIGDFFINKPKMLPPDLETIVDLADNVIVLSFGTIIRKYTKKYGEMIAEALGRLPETVLWRYVGEPPRNLKNNTHIVSWLPQTDLLANPKTKLLISHCGRGSSYESAYYGVPMVAIPMFADQPSQAARVTKHLQMGLKVDITSATADSLYQAIRNVLDNPIYTQNAKKISSLLQKQPQEQSDKKQILNWINYIDQYNGAYHYKSEAQNLSWYQLMMLDVLFFISIVFMGVFFILRKIYFLLLLHVFNLNFINNALKFIMIKEKEM